MVSLVVLQAVESAIPYRTGKSFRGIDPVIFTELPENFFDLCKKLMTVFVIPAFQDNCKFISSDPENGRTSKHITQDLAAAFDIFVTGSVPVLVIYHFQIIGE